MRIGQGSQALLVLSNEQMFIAASESEENGVTAENWIKFEWINKKFVTVTHGLPNVKVS